LLKSVLEAPDYYAGTARWVPTQKDGRRYGYKLYAIAQAELAHRLGFENGDTLTSVAGVAIDHDGVFEQVREKLAGREKIEVGYERRGEPRTLEIRFTP
jgi:type II secretory pathway component PulC